MTKEELKGGFVNLIARKGYVIRRIGADPHSDITEITVKIADIDNYEEVLKADAPAYTKAEYDAKVAEMVREKYSESEEFALQRKAINAAFSPSVANSESAMSEYAEYNAYVEECKIRAKNGDLYADLEDELSRNI